MLAALPELLDGLVDLVLPRACLGCGRPGRALCPACAVPAPVSVELPDLHVTAAARYEGVVRAALLAYKERNRRDLAGPLAGLLAVALDECGVTDRAVGAVLVPVPSSRAARRTRGGDHLVPIARRAAPGRVRPAIRLARAVRDSAGLGTAERADNLHGAMVASRPVAPAAILIDDITTTGATLVEAARALRAAGWRVAGAAVIAATPRRFPRTARRSGDPRVVSSGRSQQSGLT